MDNTLLPRGHHWDLHIEHDLVSDDGGSFTGGSGNRLVPHITVSPWKAVDSMVGVLKAKRACPHVVIGGRPGVEHPVAIQLIPFDRAGRALAHPAGTPETNRAGDHTIQVEICARPGRAALGPGIRQFFAPDEDLGYEGFDLPGAALADHVRELLPASARLGQTLSNAVTTRRGAVLIDADDPTFPLCMTEQQGLMVARSFASGVASWGDNTYDALGNLFELIRHRVDFPRRYAHPCGGKRITPSGWLRVEGILGHCVVPNNDHIDPTSDFNGSKLIRAMKSAPNQL